MSENDDSYSQRRAHPGGHHQFEQELQREMIKRRVLVMDALVPALSLNRTAKAYISIATGKKKSDIATPIVVILDSALLESITGLYLLKNVI
jgi:hypothetical protein